MIDNFRTEVYDIECYTGLFLYIGYDIDTKKWYEFEISQYKNDLDSLVKHLLDSKIKYAVAFNSLNYDAQILQYILDNSYKWVEYDNKRILSVIKKFSNKVISDTSYELYPPYREESLEIQQIDLFKIHHYDNKNRRTSLKWLQFSMNFPNVEESPIPFDQELFRRDEIGEAKNYCRNDVMSTYEFYRFTTGDTEHEVYKGKNKIQDRLDLIKERGFPSSALNWSDVKIGDEINKRTYMKLCGIDDPRKLKELKANRKSRKFTFGECIPNYVSFKTPEFNNFYNSIKKIPVRIADKKQKFLFTFRGTTYCIAKGGIHSTESSRMIFPSPEEILMDADVGSQYPNAIIKRGLYPSHLGKEWLVGYSNTRTERMEVLKPKSQDMSLSEEERRIYTGLAETWKLALNGGFGKTNESSNWQYDPFVQFSCTIGNQFEILMLIEELELNKIHIISANTDGIVCLFHKDLLPEYYRICKEWEAKVGNSVHGKLEFSQYEKMIQTSVNDYIAIKKGGKVKKKGDFNTYSELNKNKSRRVIPIALENYFINGVEVEETIKAHQDIHDFCIGVKSSKKYHYETYNRTGADQMYHRMVRYFVSNDGKKLLKMKNEGAEEKGNEMTNCEAGFWKCTVANEITEQSIDSYNINYKYYIDKAEKIINSIGRNKKEGKVNNNKQQLSMF